MGAATLMSDTGMDEEELSELVEIIQESSDRLIQTITDYMDISLISSGNMRLHYHDFELNTLFNRLHEKFLALTSQGFVQLEMDIPPSPMELMADSESLDKIMSHLIDNALKFTPKGKVLFGYCAVKEGIECFVEDTGIGIDRKMQNQVFDYFIQENVANTRGHEGSGLGLSIVRGLVDLHGGNIQIDSEKKRGTKITVFLPTKKKPVHKPEKKQGQQMLTDYEQAKVLIAEDEDTNFFVLDLFVRKSLQMNTIRAANGIEAIEAFKSNPDIVLVLMDIKMPVLNGIEATKKIKAINPDMPVIAITAYALSGDEHKLRMAGCDDYISKPVQKKELIRKIEKILADK